MRDTYYREEASPQKRYSVGQGVVILCLAIAAFVGVRYARLHPNELAEWMSHVSYQPTVDKTMNVQFEEIPTFANPPLKGMDMVEQQLQIAFRSCGHDGPSDELTQRVDQLVRRSEAFYETVQDPEDFTDAERRQAETRLLKTHFLAARMNRQDSIVQFDAMSQQLVDSSHHPADVAEAASLRLLKRHKFNSPDVDRLIDELTAFVAAHPDSPIGMQLFSVTSHELWRNGLDPSANKVLRAGIAIYYGRPEGNQLVSQLAEQDERFSLAHGER